MILCLYHGSTFKDVNDVQTRNITNYVIKNFPGEKVIACYYSKHVIDKMERRQTPLLSFEQALKQNYNEQDIYVLVTNLMNGHEYQNILQTIAKIDTSNKVKTTKYLLHKSNVYDIAEAVVNKDKQTLLVGHGNTDDNSDYKVLNQILAEDDNYVTTLKSDFSQVLNESFISKKFIIKPLMITSAYHAKLDIEQVLVKECIQLGYAPQIDLEPLAFNQKILNLLVSNLEKLINEKHPKS